MTITTRTTIATGDFGRVDRIIRPDTPGYTSEIRYEVKIARLLTRHWFTLCESTWGSWKLHARGAAPTQFDDQHSAETWVINWARDRAAQA